MQVRSAEAGKSKSQWELQGISRLAFSPGLVFVGSKKRPFDRQGAKSGVNLPQQAAGHPKFLKDFPPLRREMKVGVMPASPAFSRASAYFYLAHH